jgi:hypothetical protein
MPSDYVFISHAASDETLATRLTRDLRNAGVDVWTASERVEAGTEWGEAIVRALRGATFLILIASKNAIGSPFVIEEVLRFFAEQGPRGRVIPIRVEDVELPLRFRYYLDKAPWLDLAQGYDQVLSQVLGALPAGLPAREPVASPAKKSRGYVFLSYAEDDADFISELTDFLGKRGYAFWDYERSDRDYQTELFLELEGVIQNAEATLSILSPAWKRSSWTVKEYLYSEEVGTPSFLLRVEDMSPTLVIAGKHYIDFVASRERGFERLNRELKKRQL